MRDVTFPVRLLERAALGLSSVLLGVLFILLLLDVLLRWLQVEFYWGSETSGLLMAWMLFLALPMVIKTRSHIATDFLTGRLPFRGQALLRVLGGALMLVFLAVLLWKCADLAERAWSRGTRSQGILRMPVVYVQGGVVIGLGLMIVSQILVVFEDFRDFLKGEDRPE